MHASRLFHGFWGAGQMSFTKLAVALDRDVDVTDAAVAARAALDRARIPESLVFSSGVLDALDHSSPQPLWGGKLGIDATRPVEGEPGCGEPLERCGAAPPERRVFESLCGRFPGLQACRIPFAETRLTLALLVVEKERPGEGAELARAALAEPGVDIAVAVQGRAADSLRLLAWRALSSVDPQRDVQVVGRKLAVDATAKSVAEGHARPWPAELEHPREVRRTAESVASRFGLLT